MTTTILMSKVSEETGQVQSEGYFKQRLAELVKRGILDNRQDRNPKGYGLVEWQTSMVEGS